MSGLEEILNFCELDARLACAGQPQPEHFSLLAREGFEAVINLATSASTGHLPGEAELCARAGLEFFWLPVSWDAPCVADYQAFQDWLDPRRSRKVLVHCALNWRASLLCAVYRVLREGYDPATAREDVLGVWEPDPVWTRLASDILKASCGGKMPRFL